MSDFPEEKIIVCHRVSGLGDIMLQAVNGLLLSKAICSDLYVDWRRSLYLELGKNLFGSFIFHSKMKPIEDLKTNSNAVLDAVSKGIYPTSLTGKRFLSLYNSKEDSENTPIFISSPMPFFEQELHFPLLAEFEFSPEIYQKADGLILPSDNAVGLHYRHGNGEFDGVKSNELIESEMLEIVISLEKRLEGCRKTKIFISTDSLISERFFVEKLSGFNVVAVRKEHSEPYKGASHYSFLENSDRSPVDNTLESTLLDLVCLSRCKILYKDSWSSFTNWASANMQKSRGTDAEIVKYNAKRIQASQLKTYEHMEALMRQRRFCSF